MSNTEFYGIRILYQSSVSGGIIILRKNTVFFLEFILWLRLVSLPSILSHYLQMRAALGGHSIELPGLCLSMTSRHL